jgi:hypothetical protein
MLVGVGRDGHGARLSITLRLLMVRNVTELATRAVAVNQYFIGVFHMPGSAHLGLPSFPTGAALLEKCRDSLLRVGG